MLGGRTGGAIATANANGPSTLELTAGCTYGLTGSRPPLPNAGNGPDGLPPITGTLSINGNGAVLARSAAGGVPSFRILEVAPGATVALRGLTVRNGRDTSGAGGGGILNLGSLTLSASHVVANAAATAGPGPALGGGVLSLGALTVSRGRVRDNTARATGGGRALGGGIRSGSIAGQGGPLLLDGAVVTGNLAASVSSEGSAGGGVAGATGAMTVRNSQVVANTAESTAVGAVSQGGGIASRDRLTVTGGTISANLAASSGNGGAALGAGIIFGSTTSVSGTSVSGNSARAPGPGGFAMGGGLFAAESQGTFDRTMVSGNTATAAAGTGLGGGLFNGFGSVTFTASSITGNSASEAGGGIFNDGSVTLVATPVLANQPDNCAPPGSVAGCAG